MNQASEFEDPSRLTQNVMYRCACGAELEGLAGEQLSCAQCGRKVTLVNAKAQQTVSFCSAGGSGAGFELSEGIDRSGEELGHFRLLTRLGHGGMGAVYRALDESLQRFVAVKVIRTPQEKGGLSGRHVMRLLDEAIAQARLNHPHVVTIYYVGREGEEPFFAMELLPGPTLGELIKERPLPYAEVIHYARQVIGALEHASQLGLVHGDIKPSNLILSAEGNVKLCDFGLAKTESSSPNVGISGTLTYMAPELADGADPTDQSDMYSLGVTLFELTFGRRPYGLFGTTLREQLGSQRSAEVVFPEKWPASVPERWRGVLTRLLEKNPEDRYASYADFKQALRELAPVGVTNAGLLQRAMALLVDLTLWGMLLLPFILPVQFAAQISAQLAAQGYTPQSMPAYLQVLIERLSLLGLLAPLIPALATWLEWKGWRTPGRYLFQLRVVDAYGLWLGRRKRVIRSFFRYATVWVISFSYAALALGFDLLVVIIAPVDEFVLLLNTLPVLGARRQALHDRLVGSHVVLNTRDNVD